MYPWSLFLVTEHLERLRKDGDPRSGIAVADQPAPFGQRIESHWQDF